LIEIQLIVWVTDGAGDLSPICHLSLSKKAHTISQNFYDDKLLFSLSKLIVNQ